MNDTPIPAVPQTVIHENLFEHIKDFVTENQKAEIVVVQDPVTGDPAVFVQKPDSIEPVDQSAFDGFRVNPVRRRGKAVLLSLDSFIDHTNRFKDPDSVVFADNNRLAPSVTAVLDYHESVENRVAAAATPEGNVDLSKVGPAAKARFGQHLGFHAFPLSDEWKAWMEANAKPMKMAEFAAFLEDRIIDVLPASAIEFGEDTSRFIDTLGGLGKVANPGQLFDMARNFNVIQTATVRQATKLSSGEGSLQLDVEDVDGKTGQPASVTIPTMFVVMIPVFKMQVAYPMIARLRYRAIAGQPPVFWYELWRSDLVFDTAFDGAIDDVRDRTGLPVFLGKPEA